MSSTAGASHAQFRPAAFAVVCIVFLLANSAFSATPVLFSAYLDERHFALAVAGAIATGESTGLALGSALSIRLIRGPDANLKAVVLSVLGFLTVAQLLSAHFRDSLPFGAVRLASGVCVGMVQSMGSAWISQFKNSERLFAVYIGMTFLAGTVGMPFFSFVVRHAGLSGSFVTFAGLIGVAMIVALGYPRRLGRGAADEVNPVGGGGPAPRRALGLLLISVVVNFTFNGGLWTFLDQIGQRAGLAPSKVSIILGAGMFAALGVTAAAGVVGGRLGRLGPLLFAHACLIGSSVALSSPTVLPYITGVIVFHLGLAVISPYYLASLAAIEPSQHSVLCGVAAMNVGFSIGPWVVSVLVDRAGYGAILALAAALFGVSLLLVLLAQDRRGVRVPAAGIQDQ